MNDWVGQRLAGWSPDVHLNDEGRSQVASLVECLSGVPLAAIYSSPLERTLETARPIAAAHDLPVLVRETLGETQYGEWTGRSLEELRGEDLWPVIQVYPAGARFPEGESLREVQARMVSELDAICAAHSEEAVAVVSHSDPIKLAVAHYLGLPLDLFQRLTVSPASVTAFSFARFGPRLFFLNHTGTLPSFLPGEHQEVENA